jgi:MFS superfamily sulfate permease-like transporter
MLHLSRPEYLRDLFARSRWEFGIAAVVIAGELTLGVLHGIVLGVVLSLLLLIYVASHPHGAVLGRLPGTEAYRYVGRHPEAATFPGLLIWRLGGDLFFASVGHFEEGLTTALASYPATRHILLDAESVNFIDTSANDALLAFVRRLHGQGLTVGFARMRDSVRERIMLVGVEAAVGPSNFHERITDGVRVWQRASATDASALASDPAPAAVANPPE